MMRPLIMLLLLLVLFVVFRIALLRFGRRYTKLVRLIQHRLQINAPAALFTGLERDCTYLLIMKNDKIRAPLAPIVFHCPFFSLFSQKLLFSFLHSLSTLSCYTLTHTHALPWPREFSHSLMGHNGRRWLAGAETGRQAWTYKNFSPTDEKNSLNLKFNFKQNETKETWY